MFLYAEDRRVFTSGIRGVSSRQSSMEDEFDIPNTSSAAIRPCSGDHVVALLETYFSLNLWKGDSSEVEMPSSIAKEVTPLPKILVRPGFRNFDHTTYHSFSLFFTRPSSTPIPHLDLIIEDALHCIILRKDGLE